MSFGGVEFCFQWYRISAPLNSSKRCNTSGKNFDSGEF
jgi:hypothetical protein